MHSHEPRCGERTVHMSGVSDLPQMLAQMRPELRPGTFVFLALTEPPPAGLHPVMTFAEDEALTVIVPQHEADIQKCSYESAFAWISLRVQSDLEAVGLTAAFSNALSEGGISCNVVAAYYHDHIFVPAEAASMAMDILNGLSGEHHL